MPMKSAEEVAKMFGGSVDRVKEMYRRNAADFRGMAEKARRTGKNVNGYTLEYLEKRARESEEAGR